MIQVPAISNTNNNINNSINSDITEHMTLSLMRVLKRGAVAKRNVTPVVSASPGQTPSW
jgi:hypothetical protein